MYDRDKLINELTNLVSAGFSHYSDQVLNAASKDIIKAALNIAIPTQYSSESYEAYARAYLAEVESEA